MIKYTGVIFAALMGFYNTSALANPFSREVPDLQGYTYEQGGYERYCDKGIHYNIRRPTPRYDMMLDDDELFAGRTWVDHFHQ
jgi:hypothetical protein